MTEERIQKFLVWSGNNITEFLQALERDGDNELVERFLHIKNEILRTRQVLSRRKQKEVKEW